MRRAALVAALLALASWLPAGIARAQTSAAAPVPRNELPEGAGVEVAKARCLGCHGADLIVSQRLSPGGWDREVAKMERWGAALAAGERAALVAYLAAAFGVRPAVSHDAAAVAAGETTFKAACLGCHGEDLSTQQRLSAAGWGREVDKMVRWGAKVSNDDKPALVAFLTSKWGPR